MVKNVYSYSEMSNVVLSSVLQMVHKTKWSGY